MKYLIIFAGLMTHCALAQVYKCDFAGKVTFSDEPCGKNSEMTEYKVAPATITFKYGGSGCPSETSWEKVLVKMDEQKPAQAMKILDSECIWLKENIEVSGPLDRKMFMGREIILIKLNSGKKLWIDLKNHL